MQAPAKMMRGLCVRGATESTCQTRGHRMPLHPDQIRSHTLCSAQARVTLLSLGATTQDWCLLDGQGQEMHAVLGHTDPADYLRYPSHLGVTVGRVANRIANAAFALNGQHHQLEANSGNLMLHGGLDGWSRRNWIIIWASRHSNRKRR